MIEDIEAKRKFVDEFKSLTKLRMKFRDAPTDDEELFKAIGRQIFKLQHLADLLTFELPKMNWFEQTSLVANRIDLDSFHGMTESIVRQVEDELAKSLIAEEIEIERYKALEELGLPDETVADQEFLRLADNQKAHVQGQINDLRDAIDGATFFEDEKMNGDYCHRLLTKVNELQTEFSKDISSYYRGLGRMKDLADALGESGKRVKPVTDRLKDVTNSWKFFKKQAAIGKDEEPKQIPDMRAEEDEGDED